MADYLRTHDACEHWALAHRDVLNVGTDIEDGSPVVNVRDGGGTLIFTGWRAWIDVAQYLGARVQLP